MTIQEQKWKKEKVVSPESGDGIFELIMLILKWGW